MRPESLRSDPSGDTRNETVTTSPTLSWALPEMRIPPALTSLHTAHTWCDDESMVTGNHSA